MLGFLEIAVVAFALFALSRALLRWRDAQISWREALFWAALWLAVIAAVLLQEQLGLMGRLIESRRPADVFIYLSILLLFYLIFRLYVKLDNLSGDITRIVRQDALSGMKRRR